MRANAAPEAKPNRESAAAPHLNHPRARRIAQARAIDRRPARHYFLDTSARRAAPTATAARRRNRARGPPKRRRPA